MAKPKPRKEPMPAAASPKPKGNYSYRLTAATDATIGRLREAVGLRSDAVVIDAVFAQVGVAFDRYDAEPPLTAKELNAVAAGVRAVGLRADQIAQSGTLGQLLAAVSRTATVGDGPAAAARLEAMSPVGLLWVLANLGG